MRDAGELLAMLTAKGLDMTALAGGIGRLTPLDVAAALAMGNVAPHESALLMTKYCHDAAEARQLWAYWYRTVIDEAVRREWVRACGQLRTLAEITLTGAVEARLCRRCGGTGLEIRDSLLVDCKACSKGSLEIGERQIASRLKINRHMYRQQWSDRFKWAADTLKTWELNGLAGLVKGL